MSITPMPYGIFATTQWSLVLSAGQQTDTASRLALEALCERYWIPLYSYVRRNGHSAEDAQDLTQEFFARLLEHNWLNRADKEKGRFRTFLLVVMKRFLANEWDKAKTQKRGGNLRLESLSTLAESHFAAVTVPTTSPDVEFERDWAMTLLDHTMNALNENYTNAGKADLFVKLQGHLVATDDQLPYAAAAAELQMSEAAYKMAVSRIRQRYRESLRAQVAATVADPAEVESELRHLCRILARRN